MQLCVSSLMLQVHRPSRRTGFDLTDYDERTLRFAADYSRHLLAIDVNVDIEGMLDTAWGLFGKYFRPAEVNIKAVTHRYLLA